jgi:uncharacterized protein (TIGR02145 family)
MNIMNYTIKISRNIIILVISILFLVSCKKATVPAVTTGTVTRVVQTSAYCGGQVTSDGGAHVTARGVCWSTTTDITTSNNKTSDSIGTGLFSSHITGLTPSTMYYVKAYATNSEGTAYGDIVSFTTHPEAMPTLITSGLKSLTPSTAMGGGEITNDGGIPVTARGVCWNTTGGPTIADSHTSDGSGAGLYSSTLTDLAIDIRYYVRAYATNSLGTGYGSTVEFTQMEPVTDHDGNAYSVVTIGTQVWLGENLKTTTFNDGAAIPTETNGMVWATKTTPLYCWYNNNESGFKSTYGALYNWYAVNTGKLCPAGWHIPSVNEFTTLITYLGGEGIAGGKLKESGIAHWADPNVGATNSSGFTALPGGGRYNIHSQGGSFSDMGYFGYIWSAIESTNSLNAYSYDLGYAVAIIFKNEWSKRDGESVRCIKDSK